MGVLAYLIVIGALGTLTYMGEKRVLLPAAAIFACYLIWMELLRGSGIGGN